MAGLLRPVAIFALVAAVIGAVLTAFGGYWPLTAAYALAGISAGCTRQDARRGATRVAWN